MKNIRIAAIVACVVSVQSLVLAEPPPQHHRHGVVRAIVELDSRASIEKINDDYGTETERSIPARHLYLLLVPEDVNPHKLASALKRDRRVKAADVNHGCLTPEEFGGDTQPLFFYVPPSDYQHQYIMPQLGIASAHEVSTGDGIVIALLDTGVDANHPQLKGHLLPGYDFVHMDKNPDDVGNGLDEDADGVADELVGHGTFMAGMIATVAPDAQILPLKVLDDEGNSDVFRVVQGIYEAVAKGADVINLGFSAMEPNDILNDAIEYAIAARVVVVAAAGNDGRKAPLPMPAALEPVIAVAATNNAGQPAKFTNFGAYVALSAPGVGVVSTMPGGRFARASGTSISAALVSGTAGLLLAGDRSLRPDEVRTLLQEGAANLGEVNNKYRGLLGAGVLDIEAAVQQATW